MYNDAACEVSNTHLLQKTAAPYPVGKRNVNQQAPENQRYQIALEIYTVSESTGAGVMMANIC